MNNEKFTPDNLTNWTTSATWLGNLSLAFVSPPTSVLKDAAFNIVVKEVSSCPGVTLPEIPLTLTSSPAFTAGGGTQTTVGNQATFTGNTLGQVGPATLTASTTASGYANVMTGLTVLTNGNLACGDPNNPAPANTINGSPSTDFTISDPGFAQGARGFNVVKPGRPDCVPVNWTFTNNVLGLPSDPPVIDPHGNTIPPNGVSFVWDQGAQPNAAYTYTVTWQAEWFGIGSPNNRQTKFCTDATCSSPVAAQACLGPALDISSLPAGAPACVSAEVWVVVPAVQCPGSPASGQTTCVIFSTTITDIEDPPIIRGNG